MAQTAILIAIIMLLGATPIGYMQIGGINPITITFITIPVVVGAMMLGPATGALLGAFFGLTSFFTCIGIVPVIDHIGVALYNISPIRTFILCMLPRILMGWLAGLIFAGLKRTKLDSNISRITSGISGPLLNTILFCTALILLFGNTLWSVFGAASEGQGILQLFPFVFALVWLNGIVEAIVCSIVIFAVTAALSHFNKKLK